MFPAFTNFALLAGLGAIVAPILIHLLLKRKSQRMKFSSIQFFLKQDEQSMRRRKLRNLLLLATRVLLFALLVLAFARPFLPNMGTAADGSARRQLVILLDTSASMQASLLNGSQWARATEFARQELGKLKMDDRAALVACSTRADLVSEFSPASALLKKLEMVQPTFGTARLDEGLRQVAKVLATANPAYQTELCIISDLQRNGADHLAETPLPRELTVRFIDLGERFLPNIAATSLQMEGTEQVGPHATIASFSDENLSAAAYALRIDGKEVFAGTIALDAGTGTNLPLAIPALSSGWHSAEFQVTAKDSLGADNTAYATIYVPQPIHGLVLETRDAPQIFRQETYFIATALNPSRDGQPSNSRFSYEKATLNDFVEKLRPEPGRPKIEFAIVPAVKDLPPAIASALQDFVRKGGGVMFFLGDGVSAINYSTLGDILPAQFTKLETRDRAVPGWHVANFDKTHPIFSIFKEPNSGNLSLPEFTQRFGLNVPHESKVEAEFDDGHPFLVSRSIGEGRVLLVNTSADTAWNNWPKHKTFVPWLHSAARYLARRDQIQERQAVPQFIADTEVELDFASVVQPATPATGTTKQALKLQRPGGAEINLTTEQSGLIQDLLLESPGIYILKDSTGRELHRFAANLPASESDLTTLAPPDAEQQLVRNAEAKDAVLAAGLFGDPTRGKELWRVLLAAALLLLMLEPILANRMYS